ncbi:MAG TPA: hypothetical protein VGJ87_21925, partial [Roseiflexaceae bacterium]
PSLEVANRAPHCPAPWRDRSWSASIIAWPKPDCNDESVRLLSGFSASPYEKSLSSMSHAESSGDRTAALYLNVMVSEANHLIVECIVVL